MNAISNFDRFVEQSPGSVLKTMAVLGAVENAPSHMAAKHLADKLLAVANKPRIAKMAPEIECELKALAGGIYSLADRIAAERAPSSREKPRGFFRWCMEATRNLK